MSRFADRIHRFFGRFRITATIAAKLRNQANCVVAYYLGESPHPEENGEFHLLRVVAPHVSTFVDVGANVGNWTAYLLEHTNNVVGHCIEPSAQCSRKLRSRFAEANVSVHEIAVADLESRSLFSEESSFGETSSLSANTSAASAITREIQVTTLDKIFANSNVTLDFLKIDCEGWDLKVLRGASQLLDRTRFIQFEYNDSWLAAGSSLQEAYSFLQAAGFSIFLIRSSGLHPFRYELWGDFFRYANFFACRWTDHEIVRPLIQAPI